VYLADTIGELMLWYAVADVAFVGGSLVPFGGHNILEPAALRKPVLSGPHYQNLSALYESFLQDDAITLVDTPEQLGTVLTELALDTSKRDDLGQQAQQCFQRQTGALSRLMTLLAPWLPDSLPETQKQREPKHSQGRQP
jgi:3-deoxy-D-manno-octulosonic-acid transferase